MMKKKLAMLLPLLLITALMLTACSLFGGGTDNGKTDGGKPGQAVTYTVTFETNGGGGIDAQTVEKDGKVSRPADPAKDGYGFEGWYKDAALETVWDFTSDTVTKNTTLYAAWEAATVGLAYELTDDGTAYSVSKGTANTDGKVVIPSSYNGKPVTGIGEEAFAYCSGLTSIMIPAGVTSIENYTFFNCSGLTSITIPAGVTSIGEKAFYNCSGLTNVAIPDSVTSIGERAFYNCSGLMNVAIPDSVTSIGYQAFSGCGGLTSITIPDSVTSTGQSAFSGTAWYAAQPNGVVYAGKVAYKYKGTMPTNTSITLLAGTKGITGEAFYNCSALTSITLSAGVTSIGDYAFYNCSGLAVINYRGSEAEWNAIPKGTDWKQNCSATVVYNYAG